MDQSNSEINDHTTISEAIEILKQKANTIADSEEAKKFHQENPSWSNLFRKSFKPYQDAVSLYEEALNLNEWLNGKMPENGHWTIKDAFFNMTDQQRLSLFLKRVDTDTPSIFDDLLQTWWINRY